jgi:hypothetical protein
MNAHACLSIGLFVLLTFGCGGVEETFSGEVDGVDGSAADAPLADADTPPPPPPGECAALLPEMCLLPYPSMEHLQPDPASATGYRVRITDAMIPFPASSEARRLDFLARFNQADGFSIATPMLALFPSVHVDEGTLPSRDDLGASVLPTSAVQILDRETGARVPVWAEMDNRARDPEGACLDAQRSLIIRPQRALDWARRYAVVITDAARDDQGTPLPRPAPMQALMDGGETGSPSLDARRPETEALLDFLAAHDVPRERVKLAWELVTMSRDVAHAPVLAMAEAMLAALPEVFEYEVECHAADEADRLALGCLEEPAMHPLVWRRLSGTLRVPSFLNGAQRIEWVDGRPKRQGTCELPFVVLLPQALRDAPAGAADLLQVGHGLISTTWRYLMLTADDNGTIDMLQDMGSVGVGADFLGLCTNDLGDVLDMLQDFDELWTLHDKLLQGLASQHALTRFMTTTLLEDPRLATTAGAPIPAASPVGFFGVSLGAISGVPFVATSPIIDAAVLHVGSAMFASLFQHSSEFGLMQEIVDAFHPDFRTHQAMYALAQRAMDPIDPITWHDVVLREPIMPYGPKSFLWQVSYGDANAPDFGAYALQRSAGVPLVQPSPHEVFGVTEALEVPSAPATTGLVIFDAQKPPPSPDNAGVYDNTAHHAIRCLDEVHHQTRDYLSREGRGTITLHCGDGPCVVEGVDCRTGAGGP